MIFAGLGEHHEDKDAQRVEDARAGRNPKVICQVPAGWIVLGDSQFLAGYSLLLPDPVVAA